MTDQDKIKQLQDLINSILSSLDSANGSSYNPYLQSQIDDYRNDMRNIIDN